MLYCVVLCCAVLSCAVLRCLLLCWVVPPWWKGWFRCFMIGTLLGVAASSIFDWVVIGGRWSLCCYVVSVVFVCLLSLYSPSYLPPPSYLLLLYSTLFCAVFVRLSRFYFYLFLLFLFLYCPFFLSLYLSGYFSLSFTFPFVLFLSVLFLFFSSVSFFSLPSYNTGLLVPLFCLSGGRSLLLFDSHLSPTSCLLLHYSGLPSSRSCLVVVFPFLSCPRYSSCI